MKKTLFIFLVFILSACSNSQQEKLNNPFESNINEGIFYLLEGNIGQNNAVFYVNLERTGENNFSLGACSAWLENSCLYTELTKNQQDLVLDEKTDLKRNKITAKLSFDEFNHPIIAGKFYTQDDDAKDFVLNLSKKKLNALYFVKNVLQADDKKTPTFYVSKQSFLIPEQIGLDKNIASKLNQQLFDTINTKELQERLQNVQKEFGSMDFEFNKEQWDVIYYIDDKVFEISQMGYEYTGGAHGLTDFTAKSFSLENGEVVSNKSVDLFKDVNDEKLLTLVLKALENYDKTSEFTQENGATRFLQWYGNTDKQFIPLPEEFFVTEKGVEFIFRPYEIASYAEGFINITLSFDELKEFIRKDSFFAYLFK